MTTEIYCVRHGQSVHNQLQTIAGQLDSELTPLGFEDARSVAAALGRRDFDIVYCSDLLRARQTAETIMNTLQFSCPVRYSPLIRELDYGRFTEKTVAETFLVLNYKRVPDQRYPDGESFNDMQARVRQFLSQLLDESAGQRILVVAHAGSIRLLAMLIDPAHQQEHLDRAYGNRFIGKAVIDGNERVVSFEVFQNPERGGF
jgi:2,3-bisphosphoglycerate-dependent phosphoglycerate mutase